MKFNLKLNLYKQNDTRKKNQRQFYIKNNFQNIRQMFKVTNGYIQTNVYIKYLNQRYIFKMFYI